MPQKPLIDQNFTDEQELLFRAVWSPEVKPNLWLSMEGEKPRLSSAAFTDPRGCSVDRQANRSVKESVAFMKKRLHGLIFAVDVKTCMDVKAIIATLPSATNPYHCEIIKSKEHRQLDSLQALALARNAKAVEDN